MEHSTPELGRFAKPAMLILVSLSDGPKHGFAIMTDVEAGSGRPMVPGPCTRRSLASRSAASSGAFAAQPAPPLPAYRCWGECCGRPAP